MTKKASPGHLPKSPFLALVLLILLLSLTFTGPCLAAPAPITCDPQEGIWSFGLEWIADTCVPSDMTDSTVIHYINNAIECNRDTNQVTLFSPYGDGLASVTDIAGFAAG